MDDDEEIIDLLTDHFKKRNGEALATANPAAVVDKLQNFSVKLMLLDLKMTKLDGFEVLERIKKNEKLSDLPVLILSNLGQKADVQRAMSMGAQEFLIKSNFTLGEIVEKIKTILKKKYV